MNRLMTGQANRGDEGGHGIIVWLTILAHVVNQDGELGMGETIIGKPKGRIRLSRNNILQGLKIWGGRETQEKHFGRVFVNAMLVEV